MKRRMKAVFKLIVICGHGAGDPGACSNGYEEAQLVRQLGNRIKELGGDEVYLYDTSKNCYKQTQQGAGIYELQKFAGVPIVELHMDAFNTQARGGHIIIQASANMTAQQGALRDSIVKLFPGRSTTCKKRSDLLNCNVAQRLGLVYCLAENGFIDNSTDREIFLANIEQQARYYLAAFGIEEQKPAEPVEPQADVWILHELGDGYVKLESSIYPGQYLLAAGANAQQ